jgi:hypothetical protein
MQFSYTLEGKMDLAKQTRNVTCKQRIVTSGRLDALESFAKTAGGIAFV